MKKLYNHVDVEAQDGIVLRYRLGVIGKIDYIIQRTEDGSYSLNESNDLIFIDNNGHARTVENMNN